MSNAVRTFRAPGRVNLIGEHTDYNLGFVLPIALNLATYVEVHRRDDGRLHLASEKKGEECSWDIADIAGAKPAGHWTDYVIGVARELIALGFSIQPSLLRISSKVPEGSGLSSSAALEVSSALALLDGRSLDKLELAKMCRRAENVFVGMPCGIMDQYVSVFGRDNAAVRIDCRSLEHQAVALPSGVAIVIVNSRVKHELGNSAYRVRVSECALAVEALRRKFPEIQSLRDCTLEKLEAVPLADVVRRRAKHIVTENLRVNAFVEAAVAGKLDRMGKYFAESHASMRDDYEISCEEIDFLVDTAAAFPNCYGARMTGGGFGGCTVNLVEPDAVPGFETAIRRAYFNRYGIEPTVTLVVAAEGANEVETVEPIAQAPYLAG